MHDSDTLSVYPELFLQKIARRILSEPGRVWQTTTGIALQALSVGEWNLDAGPDFKSMAALVGGKTLTGDGELHKKSSDWLHHKHDRNPAYDDVLIHFVLEDDSVRSFGAYTVVLPAEALQSGIDADTQDLAGRVEQQGDNLTMMEMLQDYTLRRIVRKSSEAMELCRQVGLENAITTMVERYATAQQGKKRRPKGVVTIQHTDAANRYAPVIMRLLQSIAAEPPQELGAVLEMMRKESFDGEGKATRSEILINIALPLAMAIASSKQRSELLEWFWGLAAPHTYSSIRRKFPQVSQDYIWQQQGILEYYYECRVGRDKCAELLFPYEISPHKEAVARSAADKKA